MIRALTTVAAAALLAVTTQALAPQQAPAEPEKRKVSLTGKIDHHPGFTSKVLGNTRNLIVYLPPGYEGDPKRRYPVLYMHDGQNIMDGMTSYLPNKEWRADEAAETLIQAKLIEPIIIVGIDNAQADRGNEYLPVQVAQGTSKYGGNADKYTRFVVDEVMPLINERYRTKTGPKNTGLCGSSFGGVITLHMGLSRPDVFGKLAVVSPSLWVGNGVQITQVESLKKKLPWRIWVDLGTLEGANSVEATRRLARALTSKGWKEGKDLACVIDPDAAHNEVAWAHRMPQILLFLFGNR